MNIFHKKISTRELWSKHWESKKIAFPEENIIEQIIPLLNKAGMQVLEVGAGSGATIADIATKCTRAFALDYSLKAISFIKASAREFNVNLTIVCADAEFLPFKDKTFDIVFSGGLIEHFHNPVLVLKEKIRVLKSGGYILATVPQKWHIYTLIKKIKILFDKWFAGWEIEYSIEELIALFENCGVKVIKKFGSAHHRNLWRIQSRLLGKEILPSRLYKPWKSFWQGIEKTWLGMHLFWQIGIIAKRTD